MCKQCDGQESFKDWLARMDATMTSAPKGPDVDWVVDGHGHLLDPSKDVLDVVAQNRLAARQADR